MSIVSGRIFAMFPRRIMFSVVRNVKTDETFRVAMSRERFNRTTDVVLVYSQTTDGVYVWNVTKRFQKSVLEFVRSERYVIGSNDHKSFINTEYHIKSFRGSEWTGTRFVYDTSEEEAMKIAQEKKSEETIVHVFENHKLIATI